MNTILKYHCELCREEIEVDFIGKNELPKDEYDHAVEYAKHFHWHEVHKVCAICGESLKSIDLNIIVNDGHIAVHDKYTDEYRKVKVGEPFWLNVHKKCVNDDDSN